jgi:TPR repeat protein
VWRGVTAIIAGAILAAFVVLYHREVGHTLIWLGATLTGDTQASKTAPPLNAATPSEAQKNSGASGSIPSSSVASPNSARPDGGAQIPVAVNGQPDPRREVTPTNARNPKLDPRSVGDVQTLWALVEAGDTRAEVALADHYARGDGVIKSCGQAKVLLNAAAKKGDAEAKRKLDDLAQRGCP